MPYRSQAISILSALILSFIFALPAEAQTRVRKNWTQLTATERGGFISAMDFMYQNGTIEQHNQHHYDVTAQVHSNAGGLPRVELFLPWHRQSALEFENDLLAADLLSDNVQDLQGLPYWDFIADRTWGVGSTGPFSNSDLGTGGVNTAAFFSSWNVTCPTGASAAACFASGPLTRGSNWGSGTSGTIPSSLPTEIQLRSALASPTFFSPNSPSGFSNSLENDVHNNIHVALGGQMLSRAQPVFDPAFWLVHANIDRIWASRQAVYGQGNTFTSTAPMPGFQTSVTPQAVLNINNMNYEYDSFVQFVPPEIIDDFTPDFGSAPINITATLGNPVNNFERIARLHDTPGPPISSHMGRTTSVIELGPQGGESVTVTSNPPSGVLNIASSANANGGVQLSYYSNGNPGDLRLRHDVSNRVPSEGVVVYFDKPLASVVELDVVLRSDDPSNPVGAPFDAYEQARAIPTGSAAFFPFQLFKDQLNNVDFVTPSGQLPNLIDGMEFVFKVNNGDDFAIDRIEIGPPLPGFTQNAPLFPTNLLTNDPVFRYRDVRSGRWYDPPRAEGYEYRVESDTLFTQIGLPEGYGEVDVSAVAGDGSLISLGHFMETEETAGTAVRFADYAAQLGDTLEFDFVNSVAGIRAFQITGLDVDPTDPSAFPLFINASTVIMSFSQTPLVTGDFDEDGDVDGRDFLVWQRNPAIGNLAGWQANYGMPLTPDPSSAVPEPSAWFLLLFGLVGFALRRFDLSAAL